MEYNDKDIKYLENKTVQLLSKDNVLYFGVLLKENISDTHIILDYTIKYTKQKLLHSDHFFSEFFKSVRKEDFKNAVRLEKQMKMKFNYNEITEISMINHDLFVWLCEKFKDYKKFRDEQ